MSGEIKVRRNPSGNCSKCKEPKEEGRVDAYCKACRREYQRDYNKSRKNVARIVANRFQPTQAENIDLMQRYLFLDGGDCHPRTWDLKRFVEGVYALFRGKCDCCETPLTVSEIWPDYDATDELRGLVCEKCFYTIRDKIDRDLDRAQEYFLYTQYFVRSRPNTVPFEQVGFRKVRPARIQTATPTPTPTPTPDSAPPVRELSKVEQELRKDHEVLQRIIREQKAQKELEAQERLEQEAAEAIPVNGFDHLSEPAEPKRPMSVWDLEGKTPEERQRFADEVLGNYRPMGPPPGFDDGD